ncbi:hypothetical protein QBC35DRAFT_533957 [Podospora australis]|uniref:Uncharacterized protein n=1 Tax=Podospora australis TaxID=1536484 RepID=A0AAN7AFU3_9PEZI|nr:hypothetical protein QBC35DRAFT_533957 [Podospora australis]
MSAVVSTTILKERRHNQYIEDSAVMWPTATVTSTDTAPITTGISATTSSEATPSFNVSLPPHAQHHNSLAPGQIAAIVLSSIGCVVVILVLLLVYIRGRRSSGSTVYSKRSHHSCSHSHHSQMEVSLIHPDFQPDNPPERSLRPVSRWISQVRRHQCDDHQSVSLPSSGASRGQPDMVSDASSTVTTAVTHSSNSTTFKPTTPLRHPRQCSGASVEPPLPPLPPAYQPGRPSIYISPATESLDSVATDALASYFPLPPAARLSGIGVQPEPGSIEYYASRTSLEPNRESLIINRRSI